VSEFKQFKTLFEGCGFYIPPEDLGSPFQKGRVFLVMDSASYLNHMQDKIKARCFIKHLQFLKTRATLQERLKNIYIYWAGAIAQ
jgi:hypothetical protein